MSELKKILVGVPVEWKSLGAVLKIKNGKDYKGYKAGKVPVYGSGGIMTYIDTYVCNKPSVLIPRKGSLKNLFYLNEPFWTVDTIFWTDIITEIVDPKFVFHYLKTLNLEDLNVAGGVPSLTQTVLNKIKIPIPCPDNPEKSLKIQEEIVRILDSLSEETNQLTAALQKELQLHQKQYNYFREELFKFEGKEVEWKSLVEIAEIGTGSRNTNEAAIDGKYPFFVRSQIPRKINEFEFDETAIITAGDGVGVGKVFHFVNEKYALHQRAYRIVVKSNKVIPKFLFYYIKSNFSKYVEKNSVYASVTSLRKPMFEKYPVPVASIEEQERIIKIIDDLDFTTNSIIEEIQKEIALRNKQYVYYRDRLLSFHSLQTDADAIQ